MIEPAEDPFRLARFLSAQDGGVHDRALEELRSGRKTTHWMWFVLPQLTGLGRSAMAQRYGIDGLDEARAYGAHPILGRRLRACATALLELDGSDPERVMGSIDAQKLRSSMTLFTLAFPNEELFREVLARYFGGSLDPMTTDRLGGTT